MPGELPGTGYHPYLEVPWDTLKFPLNSRRACIRIPVSRVGQEHAGRGERRIGFLFFTLMSRVFPTGSSRFTNIRLPLVQESFLVSRGDPHLDGLSTEGSQWGLIMYPSGGGFVVWPPPSRSRHNQDDSHRKTHQVKIFDRLQSPSIVGLQLPGLLRACQQPAIRKKFIIRKQKKL
ncbi:hypothetical protein ALC60_08719 [Trachymyrmex zeteki]|uniref:Uncharacterized protein n=1 Tax=Mycetomoellerius zeteki TaxID=64791 RepID=A0A151WWR8_9HYME|nr:hypothetical protein ALC60_08719 [Trachymyrmex zeteki]